MNFVEFLKKYRKKNGEEYLEKSINKYSSYIEKYKYKFDNKNNAEVLKEMNLIIDRFSHANLRAAFRLYLIHLGVDEDDDKLKLLKKIKKRANSLNSLRILGSKVIQKRDLKMFFDSLDDEWKLIIGFLYDTACRENEMLTLKWKNVIIHTEGKIAGEALVLGKGNKKRSVFLSQTTVDLLKKLRSDIKKDDLIFQFRMKGGKLYARQEKALIDGMKKRTLKVLDKAYTPHSLRHSKLTHLSENGGGILGLASIAGHSDISTTNIYAKMSKKVAKKTYEDFTENIL